MPILPKYELKQLFESGDKITEESMINLIDATYTPKIVGAGSVFVTQVETAAGTTITIGAGDDEGAYVPMLRTLTINEVTYDMSENRTWTIPPPDVIDVFGRIGNVIALEDDYQLFYPKLTGSYNDPSWITGLDWTKINNTPTTIGDLGIVDVYTKAETYSNDEADTLLNTKVDKVTGKELSANDFTDTLKTKLDGIAVGAEVNVNADWNSIDGDAQILNKPTTIAGYGIMDAYTKTEANVLLNAKVDKVTGKELSANDFTNTLKTKLDNIAAGAEVNVNPDWNATSGDAQILNKPTTLFGYGITNAYTKIETDSLLDEKQDNIINNITGIGVVNKVARFTGTGTLGEGAIADNGTVASISSSGSDDTFTVNHTSGSGKALRINKSGNGEGLIVEKASGSGNAATFIGDLEATVIKKTGGTSSQFLKANGTVDSTTYTPVTELVNYQLRSEKNQANGYPSLDANSKIPTSQIPAISVTDVYVVSSEANMLALAAQQGDIAIRIDVNKTFILKSNQPTLLGEWAELLFPPGTVTSIFGRTAVVTAEEADYQSFYPRLSQTYSNPTWIGSLAWDKITGAPTTLAGFGITDAYTKVETDSLVNTKEDIIAAGTTAQYYRGDKTFQTLNTAAVPESGNLYHTTQRVRDSISVNISTAAYNPTTGVISIPAFTSQLNNNSGYLNQAGVRTSLSYTPGIASYNNATGVFTIPTNTAHLTNGSGFITLGEARNGISTTPGVAGYNNTTGVITIPTNTAHLVNVSGFITLTGARQGLSFEAGGGAYTSSTGVITIPTEPSHVGAEPAFSKNTAFNKNFGTTSGTVAEGNDSRILNGQTSFDWGNHASAGYLTSLPAHTHAIGDVTGLQTALDGKSQTGHTHSIGEVSGLQTALDGKESSFTKNTAFNKNFGTTSGTVAEGNHTHAIGDVTGLQTALDGKAATSHTHSISQITNLQTVLDGKSQTGHTHSIGEVSGLQTALDGKESSFTKNTAFNKNFGTTSGTVAEGNHVHGWTTITGRPTALSQFTNDLGNYGGWITGINSSMVTSALGYTPYNSSNPSGFITSSSLTWTNISGKPTNLSQFTNDLGNYGGWITGINSSMVTSALGYTPYNSSNPNGYISSYSETDTLQSVTNRGATTTTNITAAGFFQSSDINLKDVVDNVVNEEVNNIEAISYKWKDGRDDLTHVGYSAQEVEKVLPDAVIKDASGNLTVNYIEVLVAKIAQLESKIKKMEDKYGLE